MSGRNVNAMSGSALRTLTYIVCSLIAQPAHAAGTPADTAIANAVTVDYTVNGSRASATAGDNFRVAEVIDVVVTSQDAANVEVDSPDTDRVLTFRIANTGNGVETFALGVDNDPAAGDDFDAANGRIFLDSNGNGVFDGAAADAAYKPGINDPELDANGTASITLFVVADIPSGLAGAATDDRTLTAASTTPNAAGAVPGAGLAGAGDGGVQAVVGASQAAGTATGTYEVGAASVALTKTAAVIAHGQGCSTAPCTPLPGATIRYTIEVAVTGNGRAENLVINDPVPANTRFVPGSIDLDARPQTDADDGDAGRFTSGAVTVDLGEVAAVTTRTITFDVTID